MSRQGGLKKQGDSGRRGRILLQHPLGSMGLLGWEFFMVSESFDTDCEE